MISFRIIWMRFWNFRLQCKPRVGRRRANGKTMSDDPQSGDGQADAGLPGGVPQDDLSDSSSSDSSSSDSSSSSTNGAATLDPTRWSNILMGAISTNTGLRTGNAVTYLIDGPVTFTAMLTAINVDLGKRSLYLFAGMATGRQRFARPVVNADGRCNVEYVRGSYDSSVGARRTNPSNALEAVQGPQPAPSRLHQHSCKWCGDSRQCHE